MFQADSSSQRGLASYVCIGAGLLLLIWALSDDPWLGGGPGFGLAQAAVALLGVAVTAGGWLLPAWSASILSTLVSLCLAVTLAEVVLRVAYAERYLPVFTYDEQLLYGLIPGARKEYRHSEVNGGTRHIYEVNGDGFRGPPLLDKEDQYRVIVYGDSFIQGEFSPLGDTFVAQLEGRLQRLLQKSKAKPISVEVINAGVAGYGPDQILLKSTREIPDLDPDLVVFSIYSGNDYGDLLRNKIYKLAGHNLVVNKPEMDPRVRNMMLRATREPAVRRLLRTTWSRWQRGPTAGPQESRAERIDRFLMQHREEYEAYVVRGDNRVGDLQEDPYTADISLFEYSDSSQYKIRLMKAILESQVRVVREAGAASAVMVIPHPIDLCDGDHESGLVDKVRYPEYEPRRLADTTASLAELAGFEVINLFDVLRVSDPATLFFRGGDDHWNAAGQAIAAKAVADTLISREIVRR